MTLQQKLLAKQSKKGFTLVELVVVIAILAILAAIAIPAVVNIIQSATNSAGESEAASVDSACKTLYSGIKSGSITSDMKYSDGTPIDCAASKGASVADQLAKARGAKIKDAQKYSGLDVPYDNLAYYTDNDTDAHQTVGTIIFVEDPENVPDKTTSLKDNAGELTLGELYKDQ